MQAIRLTAARRLPIASRTFVSSASRASGGSHVSNNDPEVLEREKQRNLSGNQHDTHKHAPGWNEPLASISEAFIKADQAPVESPEELTKVTIEHIKKRHGDGADVVEKTTTEAFEASKLERDEVEGPLRSAKSK